MKVVERLQQLLDQLDESEQELLSFVRRNYLKAAESFAPSTPGSVRDPVPTVFQARRYAKFIVSSNIISEKEIDATTQD